MKRRCGLCGIGILCALASVGDARATQAQPDRAEVVRAVARNLVEGYVYESTGRALADSLERALAEGAFAGLDDETFARRLTELLSRVSDDRHLGVSWVGPDTAPAEPAPAEAAHPAPAQPAEPAPAQPAEPAPAQPAEPEEEEDEFDPRDHGFEEVAVLPGGVGYLNLTGFSDDPRALEYADSVLASLEAVTALIIDLRQNTGGGPQMVRLVSTYLFEEPTHLVSTFMRGMDAPRERWTLDSVRGKRLSVPVYLLTSRSTLSAAESFTFGLKSNNRVTIVGERTKGGGHFGEWIDLPRGFTMFLPQGRTYDPRTNRGWEAEGIEPDVSVPADEALEAALRLIQGRALGVPARPRKTSMAWFRRTTSSSSSRPTREPSFVFGTVASLSTMRRLGASSPLRSFGWTSLTRPAARRPSR